MIRIVRGAGRGAAHDVLREFFQARQRFLTEAGWTGTAEEAPLTDAFDDALALYAIAYDGPRLVGGARLRPASAPRSLPAAFPDLAAPLSQSPTAAEMSHLFLDGRYVRRRQAFLELMAGVAGCADDLACTSMIAAVEMRFLHGMLSAELRIQFVAETQRLGDLALAPVKFRANATVSAQLKEYALRSRPASLPLRERLRLSISAARLSRPGHPPIA